MPLSSFLPSSQSGIPIQSLLLGHNLEHLQDTRHHTLEPAEIDVSTLVKATKDLISILLHLVLDVHLSTLGVRLFPREGIVELEVGELRLNRLPLSIVEQGVRISYTEEEPSSTLVSFCSRGVLNKQAAQEGSSNKQLQHNEFHGYHDALPVRCNASTSGNHDEICIRLVFWHEHHFTSGTSEHHLIPGLRITKEVRADPFLRRVFTAKLRVKVCRTTNT